jgi:hypothetical protein
MRHGTIRRYLMKNEHKAVLANRVKADGGAESRYCEECGELMVFAFSDSRGNKFSVGLSTVIDCLLLAIEQNELPKLPSSWFDEMRSRVDYSANLYDEVCYYDGKWPGEE